MKNENRAASASRKPQAAIGAPRSGAATPQAAIDGVEAAVFRDGLLKDSIPFWTSRGYDEKYGGIITGLDRQGNIIDDDKGIWQQGRFAWIMGWMYNHIERNPDWLAMARGTLEFLRKCGYDSDGRMFFHVTRDGRPIRKRRYAFSESFAAIAAAEFARATGEDAYRKMALDAYSVYRSCNGVPPKFTETRPTRGIAQPMIDIFVCQCLREAIGYEEASARIDADIAEIAKLHVRPDLRAVMGCVAPDGSILDHIPTRQNDAGDAIECSWLIMREGRLRNRPDYVKLGAEMLDISWERGWDRTYGGILYCYDVYGHPLSEYWQDMKFWWVHNEAITATLMARLLTGDAKYAAMHRLVFDWTYTHFPDPGYGDWFGYLARDGRVTSDLKGNLFKGCFHIPRMQLNCLELLSAAPSPHRA